MNVQLSEDLERLVQSHVDSGRYNSPTDVVREALRLFQQWDEVFTLRKDALGKQIEEGWQPAKLGELVDGEEVFDRMDAELEAMHPAAQQ